ncbi:MAG: ROK family protein [Acidobacteria bacterium]|nr:MAG: ROK family protein [Acidobacteriota bacterium]
MKVLIIDVGGTNVKFRATGHKTARSFPSGAKLTPRQMVRGVKELAADWKYDAVTIGYPGVIKNGRVVKEPQNLAPGWVGFNFKGAFGCPVKVINDAAMQALGSYKRGLMLFLGLGTGLGSALIADGVVVPLDLAHLSYKHGSYEHYMGLRGLKRLGKSRWRKHVADVAKRFMAAIHPDDLVLGGGVAKDLGKPPKGCRMGDNADAFLGGSRLWENAYKTKGTRNGSYH